MQVCGTAQGCTLQSCNVFDADSDAGNGELSGFASSLGLLLACQLVHVA
jgi:hypothetical protein